MSSATESSLSSSSVSRLRPQRVVIAIALALFAFGAIALSGYGWKHSVLFLIGGLLGITLYHSSFGFASAYRKLFIHRNVDGMLAQLVMLAVATLLFAPVLASGSVFGQAVKGAIAPVGVPVAIGATLFGVGMQLGGACGCGTLYTIGGGSLSMLLTLFTFCVGAFAASLTRQLWTGLPATPPISLGQTVGWIGAVVIQFVLFALVAVGLRWWAKGKETVGQPEAKTQDPSDSVMTRIVRGPWTLVAGAIALAVLNWLTLILSGQPWRVTWGFALWAAQVATWLGWNPANSPFWSSGAGQKALNGGIFADVSSMMNIGIVLGAILAAALAGRLIPKGTWTTRGIAATLIGGLIMGYGAFLAFGCNVSAFFSGIASTSVHGWLWIICALVGTAIGLRLRPLFRLPD